MAAITKKDPEITGISITKEWAIKAGAEKRHTSYYLKKDGWEIEMTFWADGGLMDVILWIEDKSMPLTRMGTDKFQYVHHLQNLWMDLTGEELEFKA